MGAHQMRKNKKQSRATKYRWNRMVESLEDRTLFSVFFVDSTATPGGNGADLQHPFTTITQAADVAQAGDTVMIRGGEYHETLAPGHDGTIGNPITFEPYNNEKVTLSAGD